MIGFFLAIALGLAAGLMYGWWVSPTQPKNTLLSSLRPDYQVDYVLMVAEAYPETTDLPGAINLLRQLNPSDPLKAVDAALVNAQQYNYPTTELQMIANLEVRIRQSGVGQ
jgi:hypothetical protein